MAVRVALVMAWGLARASAQVDMMGCVWKVPGHPDIWYNLTQMMVATEDDMTAEGKPGESQLYFVHMCSGPQRRCSSTECASCKPMTPAATQTWSSTGDTCGSLGDIKTAHTLLRTMCERGIHPRRYDAFTQPQNAMYGSAIRILDLCCRPYHIRRDLTARYVDALRAHCRVLEAQHARKAPCATMRFLE